MMRLFSGLEKAGTESLSSRFKPLTLLWVIGRMESGLAGVVRWSEFRDTTPGLFERFGSPLPSPDIRYPFWELAHSRIWSVDTGNWSRSGTPGLTWLDGHDPSAGSTEEVTELLRDPATRAAVADRLIRRFFRDFDEFDLREAVGLPVRIPLPLRDIADSPSRGTAR